MKTFLFASAVTLVSFATASGQAPVPTTPAVPAPGTVVGSATPAVSGVTFGSPASYPIADAVSAPVASRRVGLFSRLRGRGTGSTVMSAPLTTATPYTATVPTVGTGTVITTPGTTGTVIPNPLPTTTTPGTTVPAPMPGTKVPAPMPPVAAPAGTTQAMPAVTGTPVVVTGGTTAGAVMTAGGLMTSVGDVVNTGGVMMSGNTVQTAGAMTAAAPAMLPAMTSTSMTTGTGRMGLISRIRARR